MRRAILIAAAFAATAVLPSGASAYVRDCSAPVDFNLRITSARNMTCGAARWDMKRYRGSVRYRFRTPAGFICTRVSGGPLGGEWRCVKGTRAYRFDFAD